ncbi:MAG: transcriptional regulator [Thermodesulfobacteriota bacterium]
MTQSELAYRAAGATLFVRDLEQGKETLRMDKVQQGALLFGHRLGPEKASYGDSQEG